MCTEKGRVPETGPGLLRFSVDGIALHCSEDVLAAGAPVPIRTATVGGIIPTAVAKGESGKPANRTTS